MAGSISTFTHVAWDKFHRSVFLPPQIPLNPEPLETAQADTSEPFERCATCFSEGASEFGRRRSTLLSHKTAEEVSHRFHLDCILAEVRNSNARNWTCPFRCGCSIESVVLLPLARPEYAGTPLAYPRTPLDRMRISFPVFFPAFLKALATSARVGMAVGGMIAPFLFIGSLGIPFWIRFPVKIFAGSLGGATGTAGALFSYCAIGWPIQETLSHLRFTPKFDRLCKVALSLFLSVAVFYLASVCLSAGTAWALLRFSAPEAKIALFTINTFLKTAHLLSRLTATYFLAATLLS